MRKLILLMLCHAAIAAHAQNYQNICSPGITFYMNSGYVCAFRQDSAIPVGNNDTVFISYMTLRESPGQDCFSASGGSILGKRVYKKQDGTFFFLNRLNDTLTLKTQAELNSSWKFCDLSGESRVDATVSAISQDSVLGRIDNAKTITFQAKDSNGINIPYYLNQDSMKLSQHYGLTKTFDLYFALDDLGYSYSTIYSLAGKTNPVLGIQNLTWRDIYDFDIGDEFHYSGNAGGYYASPTYWRVIKRVLEKKVAANADTISYKVEYCKIKYDFYGNVIEAIYDTVVESYDFLSLYHDKTIGQLPEALIYDGSKFNRNIQFNDRQTQEYTTNIYGYSPSMNAWCFSHSDINPFDPGPSYKGYHYSRGLGQTYLFDYLASGQHAYITTENLVYFKKGSEIWGTPISTNCKSFMPVEEKRKHELPDLRIIPNPLDTQADIYLDNVLQTNLHYLLINEMGAEVQMKEITTNPFNLNRAGLQSGIYFLLILNDKNTILLRKKIIIQ